MSYDPAAGFPRVVPALQYRDLNRAADWLTRVFGFREILRFSTGDVAQHIDMEFMGGFLMVESADGSTRPGTGPDTKIILVYVDDVDSHYERVRAEGATTLGPPADKPWGLRQYRARDLEGHTWEVTQHIRDVEPAQWGAVAIA